MQSKTFYCGRHCGSHEGYLSGPRGFVEKYLLPLLLLRPVRCGICFRRYYMSVHVRVSEREKQKVPRRAAA